MNTKIIEILDNILIIFNSLTSLSPIIYKADWTYCHSLNLKNNNINNKLDNRIDEFLKIKAKASLEDLNKEDILFLNIDKTSYYALKIFTLKNGGDFIFVIGPCKDNALFNFDSNSCSNIKENIYYGFKTLELIIKDKTKVLEKKENYIGFHINKAIALIHSNYFDNLNVENVS
ncbi:MAG: hypothetical protein ACRCVJ_10440, partial [Clostridium sp.]|uniref:hypothetical protein n=1 Tax=Clostridium sp. TaxID=1506 RepID=UPI003F40120D